MSEDISQREATRTDPAAAPHSPASRWSSRSLR